jgi:L,D-transpeptidase YcbB
MKKTTLCRVATLPLWLFIVAPLIAPYLAGAQSLAAFRDSPPTREINAPAAVESDAPKPNSSLWQASLWDAMPTDDWLRTPQASLLLEAYVQNQWNPFFIDAQFKLTSRADALLARLERLREDDIDPQPYRLDEMRRRIAKLEQLTAFLQGLDPGYRDSSADSAILNAPPPTSGGTGSTAGPSGASPNPALTQEKERVYQELFQVASAVDVQLARCLMRFANNMNPHSRELQTRALLNEISMAAFLKELEPLDPQYPLFLQAVAKYRELAAQGGQQKLTPAATMRPGESGAGVSQLQKRLQQEGFYAGKIHGHFDQATKEAVTQFQLSHHLEPDGAVGKGTIDSLNIPFQDKLAMIEQGLQQLRSSPTRRHQRYVRINIPQFTLEYHKEGNVEAVHRVIVGKASGKKVKLNGRWVGENQTPTLTSSIERVVINPRWIVSDRIRRELSDEIAADPNYLARHGYAQMTSSPYPWGEPRLFQKPGPTNPLGQVKFEFPNAYAVFLHDTPKKHLFSRNKRDFSHGCIRVERAYELAQTLLQDDQNPAAGKTEGYLTSNREAYLPLQQPVPIVVEYLPVTINKHGQVVFLGDPYGWLQPNLDGKS